MESVIKMIIGITLGTLSVACIARSPYPWIEPRDTKSCPSSLGGRRN